LPDAFERRRRIEERIGHEPDQMSDAILFTDHSAAFRGRIEQIRVTLPDQTDAAALCWSVVFNISSKPAMSGSCSGA